MSTLPLILASQSAARLAVLRNAGIEPEVRVSGADESGVTAPSVAELTRRLAELKAAIVLPDVTNDAIVVAADSLLEHQGEPIGKPGSAEAAQILLRRLSGTSGTLWTGHSIHLRLHGTWHHHNFSVPTKVIFTQLTDTDIDALVSTGEPIGVAGGFTIDGFAGPFVEHIEGSHTNVLGLSLPALRHSLAQWGIQWPSLWTHP